MSPLAPTHVTVLAYHVGFGDCFLVRFHYPDRNRHVLIDFGTTCKPVGTQADHMECIAGSISEECERKLDALVVTHRHADHISGFSVSADARNSGCIIAGLEPDLVIQPWTEDPCAAATANGQAAASLGATTELNERSLRLGRAFVGHLDAVNSFAQRIHELAERPEEMGLDAWSVQNEVRFLGEVNLKNSSAVQNLLQMGQAARRGTRYVYFGADSGFDETVMPGVKVTVLGPPTLDQAEAIASQAQEHSEFWMLVQHMADALASGSPISRCGSACDVPAYARWLKARLDRLSEREYLAFVRQLDSVLNNTSVILLFRAGAAKLLFPGDAQIENWSYALGQPGVKKLLAGVTVYKVGHHGSRNATPKSLWANFRYKSDSVTAARRLITILSTRSGRHGSVSDQTEVPRETLLYALRTQSQLIDTQAPNTGALYTRVEVEC